MKRENRVFFRNESEAIASGFRPCASCMKKEYTRWKLKHKVHKGGTEVHKGECRVSARSGLSKRMVEMKFEYDFKRGSNSKLKF